MLGAIALLKLLYNLLITKLEVLRKYIIKYLNKKFIRPLKLPTSAPILFVKKKDSSLKLYINY